jgi:methylthioribose-1-phosphate isomerase
VNTAPKIVHIAYEPGVLRIIDQTKLPETVDVLSLTAPAAVADAIREMRVRGAPAIGIAGAYGLAIAALDAAAKADSPDSWRSCRKRHACSKPLVRPPSIFRGP